MMGSQGVRVQVDAVLRRVTGLSLNGAAPGIGVEPNSPLRMPEQFRQCNREQRRRPHVEAPVASRAPIAPVIHSSPPSSGESGAALLPAATSAISYR